MMNEKMKEIIDTTYRLGRIAQLIDLERGIINKSLQNDFNKSYRDLVILLSLSDEKVRKFSRYFKEDAP